MNQVENSIVRLTSLEVLLNLLEIPAVDRSVPMELLFSKY